MPCYFFPNYQLEQGQGFYIFILAQAWIALEAQQSIVTNDTQLCDHLPPEKELNWICSWKLQLAVRSAKQLSTLLNGHSAFINFYCILWVMFSASAPSCMPAYVKDPQFYSPGELMLCRKGDEVKPCCPQLKSVGRDKTKIQRHVCMHLHLKQFFG